MRIHEATNAEFRPYGRVLKDYNVRKLLAALVYATPLPSGTDYVPEEAVIQVLPAAEALGGALFGGLPVQFGWCNGHNTKLNCMEYHRTSEFLAGTEDFILLLAKLEEIDNGRLDTSKVKAFRVPAGTLIELYATTLHYAPCHTDPEKGFRVLIILPRGTNTEKPKITASAPENEMLWACNKWLLAHPDAFEAKTGAWTGLTGLNIDIAGDIENSGEDDIITAQHILPQLRGGLGAGK
ncbi:MAG: DUF4867 family protein [Clostridiales bacterium]|nr:DUF4867 family protein [Clostridiales bacterium]